MKNVEMKIDHCHEHSSSAAMLSATRPPVATSIVSTGLTTAIVAGVVLGCRRDVVGILVSPLCNKGLGIRMIKFVASSFFKEERWFGFVETWEGVCLLNNSGGRVIWWGRRQARELFLFLTRDFRHSLVDQWGFSGVHSSQSRWRRQGDEYC